jgi:hypothetical protein
MKTYKITSIHSGGDLGTYEAASALEAWQASVRDAGYRALTADGTETEARDADGSPLAAFASVTVTEV